MPSRLDIGTKPGVHGWAAIIDFTVNSTGGFRELGEAKASLLWSRDLILTIEPQKIHPLLSGAGTRGYRLAVETIESVSGVNCQEATREELPASVKMALREALELNHTDAIDTARGDFEELEIAV